MTDLRHFIRVYDGVVAPELCLRIIGLFDAAAQLHRGPRGRPLGQRDEERRFNWVQMITSDHPELAAIDAHLVERLDHHVRRYVGDTGYPFFPYGLEEFLIKRYRAAGDEQFPPHVDVSSTGSMRRMLAVLLYLNTVPKGGETHFTHLDMKVLPRAGRLLMFPPTFLYPLAGLPPRFGEKYILGTYLTYVDAAGTTQLG